MARKKYKIVYIGAGSFRFTIPCAMNILDFATNFQPIELWLVDIDKISLGLMEVIIKQMVGFHKKNIRVFSTVDRTKALPNADYVLISISVGMQHSEWSDIHIPLKFGIPQNTGDTVGPGGIFRGLRTVPLIVDMLKDINELCPDALVLNYTNPQGTLMLSAAQAAPRVQSIGLCHEFFYMGSRKFAKFLKLCKIPTSPGRRFEMLYGGLNHFSFITKITCDGEDIYPSMRENAEFAYETGKFGRPYNYYLLKKSGFFTYVEDRHVTEFLPQYYNYFNHEQKPFGITKLRNVRLIQQERNLVYALVKRFQRRINSWMLIKLLLRPMEGGEKAMLMAKDRENDVPKHHVCNVLNNGAISSLPDNCIVEIPCFFKSGKLYHTKIGALPKPIDGWIETHAKNQQLVVDAALSGNLDQVLKALLMDPLNAFIEDEAKIEAMIMNLLYYQRKWLPKFSESIPSLDDLKKNKYFIDPHELSTVRLARRGKYAPDSKLKAKSWPQVG